MQKWPEEVIRYIKKLESKIQNLKGDIEELKEKNKKLENRLKLYENPHTPPSKQRFKKGGRGGNIFSGRRGAPKGHHGATRKTPEPDEAIPVTADCCPDCGCNLGESENIETVIIEDLPPPQKIVVKRYEFHTYICPCCGLKFTTKHDDCPKTGVFGVDLLTYITMLRFHLRGVLRRTQSFLYHLCSFSISTAGIHNVLLRVGDACKNEYFRRLQQVKTARWRYTDETGFHVNGEKWWLWNFRTDQDVSLAVIRKSRGSKVLREIYGEKPPNGGNIVDGWRAYNYLENVQRCWAHLLREVDDYKEKSEHGKHLSEEIHQKYQMLKDFLGKDPPMKKRKHQKNIWDLEIAELVEKYSRFTELSKPVKYIKFGRDCWYTCLLYPGMEPTNNLGEQAIREHVVMRKIIGTFRSERGSENYQYIASMFATWRLQGKNVFDELERLLRRELCLS
ncbi:MAG: IS66 family transposase [Candidatus Thermoplasmatota archaeon]|nr:IS66 family transposase [Candidatus Thermoplasmatota archaeon]